VPFSTGPFHRLLLKTPCGVIPSPSVEITVAIPQRRYFFRPAAGRLFAAAYRERNTPAADHQRGRKPIELQ